MKLIWRKKPTTPTFCDWQNWRDNNPDPDILSILQEQALRIGFSEHLERVCSCYERGAN